MSCARPDLMRGLGSNAQTYATILCSDGLTSDLMLEAVRKRTAGCKTAALVVTADSIYKEKNRHVPRGVREMDALGLTVTLFDLDRQPAEQLLSYLAYLHRGYDFAKVP